MNALQKDKKKVLGRGLSALIHNSEEDVISSDSPSRIQAGKINKIDIELIDENPWQPRSEFEEIALTELAESIKTHGLIQPITVRSSDNGRYQLISGERRLRASKLINMSEIIAYVRTADDMQMIEMALVENIQRENLNSIEIALCYQRLIDECNITQDKLSEKVGKNRSTITNFLRLLKLPTDIQLLIRDNKLTMGHAKVIAGLANIDDQIELANKIIAHDLSVRDTEKMAKQINNPNSKRMGSKISLPETYSITQKSLANTFQTKVEIKRDHKGKGTIEIKFKSDEDFNRIISIIHK